MEQKIQLSHPAEKHSIKIKKNKYDILEHAIINSLKRKAELTHKEIFKAITEDFKKNKIKFEGSVEWYMEYVKLHLESIKIIERTSDKSQLKFRLVK
ncbi:MAG: DUF6958 family protein [Chitinophagaceae bacterium]